jgi:hypothetical protein
MEYLLSGNTMTLAFRARVPATETLAMVCRRIIDADGCIFELRVRPSVHQIGVRFYGNARKHELEDLDSATLAIRR